ncbi:MAG: amidohydrolase family protein [Streptosporangiales bacterium]|nr:amidohydrolase family protein [Streptosporangiales bacterium]
MRSEATGRRDVTGRRLGSDPAQRPADLVLRGGAVYRGGEDGAPTFDEALAVTEGRIVAVGSEREVERLAGSATVVVDVEGRTVVPGLIDSHLHLVRAGLTWRDEIRWDEVPSLDEALSLLRSEADRRPPGSWLRVVGGWHPGQFAELRMPTREELTERFPKNPVYVQLLYEEAVLNDAGMLGCGIVPGAEDPPGGTFARDPATGEPTGIVRGMGAFNHCLSRMPSTHPGDQVGGIRDLMRELNGLGLTGAVDVGGLGLPPENYEPLFALWRAGGTTLRTRLYVGAQTRDRECEELTGWMRHARQGFGDGWLRYVGIGEIIVFGCHDLEGLTGFPADDASLRELERVVREVAVRGWPLHMHAVLDETASAVLDVWDRVAREHPIADLRWSLAHAEPISAANLDRVRALGCGIAVQDRLVYRAADSARAWGDGAVRHGPPLRDILDRGIPLGAGTDATRVASPNPWVSLWWLVTGKTLDGGPRRVPEQRLDRVRALDAYTVGSAWFSLEEHERGRLDESMAADLAVLSDDYFTVDDDALPGLRSELTLVDGHAVHATGPFAGL